MKCQIPSNPYCQWNDNIAGMARLCFQFDLAELCFFCVRYTVDVLPIRRRTAQGKQALRLSLREELIDCVTLSADTIASIKKLQKLPIATSLNSYRAPSGITSNIRLNSRI